MSSNNCRYDIEELIEEMEVSNEEIMELYKSYFWEMKENIDDISKFLKEEEYTKVERILHNIKGVSINLNIVDAYEGASVFYENIRKGIKENYEEHLENLIKLINDAESEVQNFFKAKENEVE